MSLEIIIKIDVKWPYEQNKEQIVNFCNVKKSKVLINRHNCSEILISMPYKIFKSSFGFNPRIGPIKVGANIEKNISSLIIKKYIDV